MTIHSMHLLFVGIFFLVVSQIAPFQESLLLFMLIIGIIVVISGIFFRIVKTIGLKIKNGLDRERKHKQNPISKNYYFSYFLISMGFIFTIIGVMTMPNTSYFIENYSPDVPGSSEIPLYEGDSSPDDIPNYENDVAIIPINPNG